MFLSDKKQVGGWELWLGVVHGLLNKAGLKILRLCVCVCVYVLVCDKERESSAAPYIT